MQLNPAFCLQNPIVYVMALSCLFECLPKSLRNWNSDWLIGASDFS